MSRYYDRDGNPITAAEWPEHFRDNKFLKSELAGFSVSTVYLGLDHSFGNGPPLIYETMIFGSGPLDQWCQRYSTKEEAADGHADAVDRVRRYVAGNFGDEPAEAKA